MGRSILAGIDSPASLKKLSTREAEALAEEIRKIIVETVSHNGGHLSSNLGVIELTIALHMVFSSPEDAIVWDVGHQCYAHKLLTGRAARFSTIRKKGGLSGFPRRDESPHDVFGTGHASTSISAAYGILTARRMQGSSGKVVAVIGDGALTGGMAYEALSHAGENKKDLIVILNDNKMSIGKNTGALSEYLSRLSMRRRYQRLTLHTERFVRAIPLVGGKLYRLISKLKSGLKTFLLNDNFFMDLGFEYVGPLNGHKIEELRKVLTDVKKLDHPVVVHVVTKKGCGYSYAENDPALFHGIGPFCTSDGTVEKFDRVSFTEAFSALMLEEAGKRPDLVAVTAAMAKGTGLAAFSHRFPSRFFDVGIAEAHAVTFAAGLAAGGLLPVVAVYSTFMQRAVDQVIHDVALQSLPVVFALDRAGAVPDDGETHQGIYDIALFRSVPGLSVLSPVSAEEMRLLFRWAFDRRKPVLLRYPKTTCPTEIPAFSLPVGEGRGIFVEQEGSDALIACTGGIFGEVQEAANILARRDAPVDIYHFRFLKPLDEDYFLEVTAPYRVVVIVEDGIRTGGIGEALEKLLRTARPDLLVGVLAFQESVLADKELLPGFVGTRREILEAAALSPGHIAGEVRRLRALARKSGTDADSALFPAEFTGRHP